MTHHMVQEAAALASHTNQQHEPAVTHT